MSRAADSSMRLPNWLVLNRNFVLLAFAYFIAAVGDNLNDLGQLKLLDALEGEESTRLRALMMFGLFLPYVLLGPVAGWCADRFSRKWTMIFADGLRAAIVVNFAVLIPWLLHQGAGHYTVMLTQATLGILAAFFSPARQAMLPTLVRPDQLVRANAMVSALAPIGAMLGFLAGGIIVDNFGGPVWNFRVNCGTYVVSALLVLSILQPRRHAAVRTPTASLLGPLVDGITYVRQHRRVGQMILLGALFWGAAGVVFACIPAVVRELVSTNYTDVGAFQALLTVGMIAGSVLMSMIGPALGVQAATLIGLSMAGGGLLLLAGAFQLRLSSVWAATSLIIVGLAGSVLLVTIMATLQRLVPDSRRGRVFGVSDMTTMGAMVLATGALGLTPIPNLDRYVAVILLVTALGLLLAAVLALRVYRRTAHHGPLVGLVWVVQRIYARMWCGARRDGPCTIPRTGPVILASNHTCGIDPMVILATSPYRLPAFVVEGKYYYTPIARWFMNLARCIPVRQAQPGAAFFRQSLRFLKEGGCLAIFPQGLFEEPGAMLPEAKRGVGWLALRSGATVIPCHISGTHHHANPFLAFLRPHRARIRYGKPIDLAAVGVDRHDRETADAASALIMQQVQALAPDQEDYAD